MSSVLIFRRISDHWFHGMGSLTRVWFFLKCRVNYHGRDKIKNGHRLHPKTWQNVFTQINSVSSLVAFDPHIIEITLLYMDRRKKNYRMISFFCLCGVHQKLMDRYWKISGNDLKQPFLFSWTVCSICIINSWKRCTIIIIIPHVFIHHTSKIWDFGLWPTRNWKLTIDGEDTWRHAHKRNYHDWAKTFIPDSWARHPTMAATWFGWILRVRKLHVILDGN